ncbi:hypothetical protein Pst134EA_002450 [Puccinia striiformis f. sp. tritici]|uniref:hypothetical protein n=1 Tax=Puccinia striiformis f. sp. tritici TaxID=168172 RepID=UPI0020080126|nr:hypothetical protein Pst134EA_002450 [Puccinia striiformis f. sp. tritici]KAH9464032.1 hypothetical protein Pst134EB_003571 [Puccinia striiformis f. sp. tritici]KAH9471812.1 hypothetical protein Pst134EA_002450 [Puccinia striiformis f. sp. tritici]KAI9609872.1 hypothetical protein H4Q26_006861 [Puccinia striiformis f. sp. tritici PST-130]
MPSSSSSSASSFSPSQPQHELHPDNGSSTDSHHQDAIKKEIDKRQTTKPLDLASYFNDLPDRASTRTKRSKPSFSIVRRTGRTSRLKGVPKSRRRNTTLTVPPSRDEDLEYDDDDDDDDDEEDLEDAEWVRERWNQLMDRQRTAEADVRRTILNRDRLAPSELSRWLDSDETCTLPLPTLGVQLRMMKSD